MACGVDRRVRTGVGESSVAYECERGGIGIKARAHLTIVDRKAEREAIEHADDEICLGPAVVDRGRRLGPCHLQRRRSWYLA